MDTIWVSVVNVFGWVAQASLYAVAAILIIAFVQMLGRRLLPARWSYAFWLILLVRMALPAGPESTVSLWNFVPQWSYKISSALSIQQGDRFGTASSLIPKPRSGGMAPEASDAARVLPGHQARKHDSEPALVLQKAWRLGAGIWLVGALILASSIAASNLRLWLSVREMRPVTDHALLELFECCRRQMKVRRVVRLVFAEKVNSPSLFGFIRPRVLLPTSMNGRIGQEELRYIFLHELAHLKNGDIFISWIVATLQSLHWFNPLVWWAFARMRADRELACDALVLAYVRDEETSRYGNSLISLLEHYHHTQPLPAVAGILENKNQLKRRLTMIAQFRRPTRLVVILAVVLLVILSGWLLTDAKFNSVSATSRQAASSNSEAQENLEMGIRAFTELRYEEAIPLFEKALQLDPAFETARMYLATVYSTQFARNTNAPNREELANKAIELYREVVAKAEDPAKPDEVAMLNIANLYYVLQQFEEAKVWSRRVLNAYPQEAEAYYRIAMMILNNASRSTGSQGAIDSMSPAEKSRLQADIDAGLAYLYKALEIRPTFGDAMLGQNLLLREKYMLERDEQARAAIKNEAELVSQKARLLYQTTSGLAKLPPPPPPPPPPSPTMAQGQKSQSLQMVKVRIHNSGTAFSLGRLDGTVAELESPNNDRYQSTPILTDGERGDFMFSQPIPPGKYKLAMRALGLNADLIIPPSQGRAPVILDMNISPNGISITSK
jgi:beta-lactamase regulating signal transducer with metallopeptidase domain